MGLVAGGKKSDPTYVCIHCTAPASALYILYPNPSNTSLIQCFCGEELDVYQSLPYPALLVDLLLFRPTVYRHLLFNRGSFDLKARDAERFWSTVRIGTVRILLDAYIRGVNVGPPATLRPFNLFLSILGYCVAETISLHVCTALSAFVFLSLFSSSSASPFKRRLRFLPLTLFYSSLPTLFLLCITSIIWHSEYSTSSTSSQPEASSLFPFLSKLPRLTPSPVESDNFYAQKFFLTIAGLSRDNLNSGVSRLGNVSGWANGAVLRKWVGGSSGLVGVSVLFGSSRKKTLAILLMAWILHLFLLHAIDPFLA